MMLSQANQTQTNNPSRRMLIAFAHPDDESFGMGGTIARYSQQGVGVYLICATNGDAGTVNPELLQDYGSIGELRLEELRCAASALNMREVITFGYRDSGMMGTPDNQHPDCLWQTDEAVVAGRIVREIRRLRPQVVVTFDPFGGYGHPDHIYMHRATTRAFHQAADPVRYPEQITEGLEPFQPDKLYYTAFPRLPLRVMIWQARLRGQNPRRLGANQDLDLVAAAENMLPVHARLNVARFQHEWNTAAQCHASQSNPRAMRGWAHTLQGWIFRHQDFTRAWPEPNGQHRIERDLFEGIP